MSTLETPIQFDTVKQAGSVTVSYTNLMEIAQGGPEVGTISVNGQPIPAYKFGGPCIIDGQYIYAPAYVRKFLGSGFKLAKINSQGLKVELLGKTKDLIYLDRIEGNHIYFFEDLNKSALKQVIL